MVMPSVVKAMPSPAEKAGMLSELVRFSRVCLYVGNDTALSSLATNKSPSAITVASVRSLMSSLSVTAPVPTPPSPSAAALAAFIPLPPVMLVT